MKTIFVGGTGLIGAKTALRMKRDGHEVTLAARTKPAPDSILADLPFTPFDYVSDSARASEVLTGHEALVFSAGHDPRLIPRDPKGSWAYLDRSSQSGQLLYRANSVGVPALFAAARGAGINVAVNVGTFYPQVIPEALQNNSYMLSRQEADEGLRALATPTFRAMSVNPSWVMGGLPGMGMGSWEGYLSYASGAMPDVPVFVPPGGINLISLDAVVDAVIGALLLGEGGKSYLIGDENVTYQQFLGAFFAGFGRAVPPVRDEPHPLLSDKAIQRGRNIWYEPEPTEASLLGFRRNDALRAIREEMIPLFRARQG